MCTSLALSLRKPDNERNLALSRASPASIVCDKHVDVACLNKWGPTNNTAAFRRSRRLRSGGSRLPPPPAQNRTAVLDDERRHGSRRAGVQQDHELTEGDMACWCQPIHRRRRLMALCRWQHPVHAAPRPADRQFTLIHSGLRPTTRLTKTSPETENGNSITIFTPTSHDSTGSKPWRRSPLPPSVWH